MNLYPYQAEGVRALSAALADRPGFLLADEPGLGKTAQALAWLDNEPGLARALVACPASVAGVWQSEAARWSSVPWTRVEVVKGACPDGPGLFIASYDRARRMPRPAPFDAVIADEAHALKNLAAARTQAIHALPRRRTLLLTGTPVLSRPEELWSLLHLAAPDAWPVSGRAGYLVRYCNAHQARVRVRGGKWRRVWDTSGASHLDELAERIAPVYLRRLKADVLPDLPPFIRRRVPLDLGKHRHLAAFAPPSCPSGDEPVPTDEYTSRRAQEALERLPACLAYVADLLDGGEPAVVVFAHHRELVEGLASGLAGFGVSLVHGPTPQAARTRAVDAFQTGKHRVFVGSTQAAGSGITLTAASLAVFCECDWTPAVMAQAEQRIHRIGQTRGCRAEWLYVEDTLDDRIQRAILRKAEVTGTLFPESRPPTWAELFLELALTSSL